MYDIDGKLVAEHRLDGGLSMDEMAAVIIRPNDAFQVEADDVQNPRLQRLGLVGGVMVTAVMRKVPFDINFEEKI